MMENCPLKFRLLEILSEKPKRTDEIVPQMQEEYGMNSDYGRDMINYDLVELVSAGLVKEGDAVLDEEGSYKQGHLLTVYSISSLGQDYLDGLKKTVKPQVK